MKLDAKIIPNARNIPKMDSERKMAMTLLV